MKLRVHLLILAAVAFSTAALAQPVNQGVASGCYQPAFAVLGGTFAQGTECESSYQLRYLANLTAGDSFLNATNDGSVITVASVRGTTNLVGNYSTGNICVNVYTFDPAEELVSCCACKITPNGLVSLSAQQDLISNTLTPASPTAITVKLLSTTPIIQGSNPLTAAESCNPAFPFGLNAVSPTTATPAGAIQTGTGVAAAPAVGADNNQNLAPALHAWASTLHRTPAGFDITETEFSMAALGTTQSVATTVKQDSEINRLQNLCSFIQSNGSGFGICKSCRAGGLGAVQQ